MDVMAREVGASEFHYYLAGASFADLSPLLAAELAGTQALIFGMPHGLLNPNYWEPHTKAGEEAESARGALVITRDDQGATWLWRANAIAPGRYLLDGVDVPVERVAGAAFTVSGPDLLKLGKAWAAKADPKDRFDWVAVRPPASGNGATASPIVAHDDLESFRLRTPGASMIFEGGGDGKFRMAFSRREAFRACARATLRGYLIRCAGRVVSAPNDKVCDDFLAHAERGLTSNPDTDFVSKGTAFEFTAWPGRTPWGWIDDSIDLEDRILVYYDRVAGIWAVAS
jgi:hypothetical protein